MVICSKRRTTKIIKCLLLSEVDKAAVRLLVEICEEHDGFDVGLQWDKSMNIDKNMPTWYLDYHEDVLTGVLSVFQPMKYEAEISGCVHPLHRRKGRFSVLLCEAENDIKKFGVNQLLISFDRKSESGNALAGFYNYRLVHSELSMQYMPEAEGFENRFIRRLSKNTDDQGMVLRKAIKDDLDSLAVISSAAFLEDIETSYSILHQFLNISDRTLFTATKDGEVVGCVAVYSPANTAMINGLAISPEKQGRGYGQALMFLLMREIHDKYSKIFLDVNSKNGVAFRLYKKMGFVESEIKDYYGKNI